MRNLSCFLDKSGADERKERLRFYRSLVPNAVLIRGADGFVCGLCGCAHIVRKDAECCLRNCLRAREDEGVVTVTALGESYTCPKCGKRFARREDAIDCHGRSRRLSKIFLAHVPEKGAKNWDDSSFSGLKETDKPGKGRLFKLALRLEAMVPFVTSHHFDATLRATDANLPNADLSVRHSSSESNVAVVRPSSRPAPALTVQRPKQIPFQQEALHVAKPMEHHEEEQDPPSEGAVAAETAMPQSEEDGPFREKGMKPFTRHDARYKCSVCGKMYFTRSDVENCFFSHPERMV